MDFWLSSDSLWNVYRFVDNLSIEPSASFFPTNYPDLITYAALLIFQHWSSPRHKSIVPVIGNRRTPIHWEDIAHKQLRCRLLCNPRILFPFIISNIVCYLFAQGQTFSLSFNGYISALDAMSTIRLQIINHNMLWCHIYVLNELVDEEHKKPA